ncbi:MAG: alpha/beta hydrolase [Deltaproteobacteria bacterium]|nr:MAG: alpha/beta hydrolase [Deltaproteobacteria bacterium]
MTTGNRESGPAGDPVVLVHGLWMTGAEMRVLGGRLSQAGFRPRYFRYRSWRRGIGAATRELRAFVLATEGEAVHLVGHSLGGVVIAKMLLEGEIPRVGKVAMLGSPMGRCSLAEKLSRAGAGRWLLGKSALEGIVGGPQRWSSDRELLVVAGDVPIGTGVLFGLEKPHDGVVRVEETRVEGARSAVVRASHVGLLLSRKVAALICDHFGGGPRIDQGG